MASWDVCIDAALQAGKISKAVADEIRLAPKPDEAIDGIIANLSRQKRETAIQAVRLSEAWKAVSSHEVSGYDGLSSLLTKDPTGKAGYGNVELRATYYRGRYHSRFAAALSRFRTRSLGLSQDLDGLHKLVRAIYGEAVDDAEIQRFAKDWHEVAETARQDFNRVGGSISKNERWLLPQNHDAATISKVGLEAWKKKVLPLLDLSQMTDDAGKAMDAATLDNALDYVYETITTHGLNKTKDFSVPRLGSKLSRRGSEKRFLYFKDADSWLTYNKEFGRGDVFATLTGWLDTKAHDIALMEILGTNPGDTFKALKAQVMKGGKITDWQRFMLDAIFNDVSGASNRGELVGLSHMMQSTRNLLVASHLGGAFLSSLSEIGFQAITSKYNSIPAFKSISRAISLMNPANEADRVFGVKLGLTADNMISRAHAANRYADVYGVGATTKIAEGVMRASLLQPWTDMGRMGFGMEFASLLAENFGKPLKSLDKNLQRAFQTYGITEADWNLFRRSTPLTNNGAKFADMLQEGGVKFHQMVMSETDYAVPMPDARVRAITTGGTGRQSIEGQAWRSLMMLKSFPLTIATTHFYRAAYQATLGDKLTYAASLFATTAVMGGVALQAKDLAAGRKPRPVDEKFLMAAVQQGGGMGIYGDFLFADANRFGGGFMKTALGPVAGLVDDTWKTSWGQVQDAVAGEQPNVLGASAQFLKRYTPDIWQTRLFTDAVFDQLELMSNPDAQRRYNRIVRSRARDYGQDYWWKPGEVLPEGLQ